MVDAEFTLASDRLDARQVLAQLAHLFDAARLSHFELELQPEELISSIALLVHQLVGTQISNFLDVHL